MNRANEIAPSCPISLRMMSSNAVTIRLIHGTRFLCLNRTDFATFARVALLRSLRFLLLNSSHLFVRSLPSPLMTTSNTPPAASAGSSSRADSRAPNQLRPIRFLNHIAPYATGSTLIEWGNTRVICGVTVEETVPRWMKEQNVTGGWITAEYSMLPYSTLTRKQRDISKGKIDGRSQEIQRLIGRAMRSAVDLEKIGPRTIWVDCDVLQADGGTRTAAITGAMVALGLAVKKLQASGKLGADVNPIANAVAAVSVGIIGGTPLLDLCYTEDVAATRSEERRVG